MIDEKDIAYWVTTENGTHIPVKRGQTKQQAVNEFLKSKGDARGKSVTELKKEQAKKPVQMTKSDWGRFYDKVAEIKRGGNVIKSISGNYVIPLHSMKKGDVPKLVITSADYENPEIVKVISFRSEEKMFDRLRRLENGVK